MSLSNKNSLIGVMTTATSPFSARFPRQYFSTNIHFRKLNVVVQTHAKRDFNFFLYPNTHHGTTLTRVKHIWALLGEFERPINCETETTFLRWRAPGAFGIKNWYWFPARKLDDKCEEPRGQESWSLARNTRSIEISL